MKICLMEMMVYLQIYTWLKFHMAQGNSETRFRKRRRKIMYRQYEDPYFLENRLKELKQMYRDAVANNADENTIIDLALEVSSLEERVNFAWQDEYQE